MQVINPSGRKVSVTPEMWPGLRPQGFSLPRYLYRPNPESDEILVSRPIGGIGDMVGVEPVVRALAKKYPFKKIIACIPPGFECLVPADKFIYEAANIEDYYLYVDLDCPADQYESAWDYRADIPRHEIFALAANVAPSKPNLAFPSLTPDEWATLNDWMQAVELPGPPYILLQHHSENPTKDACGMNELAEYLADGFGVGVLAVGKRSLPTKHPGVYNAVSLTLPMMLSVAAMSSCIIAPDSAFFHIGGGLGIPTLGLFGPTDGGVTSSPYRMARVLQAECPHGCLPCGMYGKNKRGHCPDGSFGECMEIFETDAARGLIAFFVKGVLDATCYDSRRTCV